MPTRILLIVAVGLLALPILSPLTGRSAAGGCPTPTPTTTAMNGGAYFETSILATPTSTHGQVLWFPIVYKYK